jgi:hypothetical protein
MANRECKTAKGKTGKMIEGDGRKTPFKESIEKLKRQIRF